MVDLKHFLFAVHLVCLSYLLPCQFIFQFMTKSYRADVSSAQHTYLRHSTPPTSYFQPQIKSNGNLPDFVTSKDVYGVLIRLPAILPCILIGPSITRAQSTALNEAQLAITDSKLNRQGLTMTSCLDSQYIALLFW